MDWKVILICVSAAFAGVSSIYIFKMKPHNVIETEAEKIIKDETGLSVDFDFEEDLSCCEDEPITEDNVKGT